MKSAKWLFALAVLVQANAQTPHIKAALDAYRKGLVEQRQKQFDSAIKLFKQAIEIEPTFTEVREALIQANLSAGRKMEAAAAMTQLLEIAPGDIPDRLSLAQILQQQHQEERALAQFSAVLNLAPYNPDALLGFASVAQQLGMADRAAEALERGRKHFPQDARFKITIGTTPQKP